MEHLSVLRETIAEACRILGTLEATSGTYGHVSALVPDRPAILIKGKGAGEVGLRYTSADDLIEIDFEANKLSGRDDLQPPSESYIHTWLYRRRSEVMSIVHVHPVEAIALSVTDKPIVPITVPGSGLVLDGVPVYPKAMMIHNDALGEALAATMGEATVCLMTGHGITVVGESVEDATVKTMQFVELSSLLYRAYLLGDPRPLDEEEQAFARVVAGQSRRPRGTRGGRETVAANWKYYRALAIDKSPPWTGGRD